MENKVFKIEDLERFRENNRLEVKIDDTPLHKILREAVINSLVHADYFGRQGVVISKDMNGFVFANPGRMRLPISEAVEGGISDPRNGILLKMFSLIRFGERAGSGLNGILYVWNKVFHANAKIEEKENVDRTILTLPFEGHEQDVKAMIQMYDNPEELELIDDNIYSDTENVNSDTENVNSDTENVNSDTENVNSDTENVNSDTETENSDTENENSDTETENSDTALTPKQIEVLRFCVSAKSTKEILSHLELSYHSKNVKKYVMDLVDNGFLAMTNPESQKNPHQRYYAIKDLLKDNLLYELYKIPLLFYFIDNHIIINKYFRPVVEKGNRGDKEGHNLFLRNGQGLQLVPACGRVGID